MKFFGGKLLLVFCGVLVILFSGCSKKEEPEGSSMDLGRPDAEPMTLTFASALMSNQQFQEEVAAPVKAKWEHITLEFKSISEGDLDKWIAENNIPDLIHTIDKAFIPVQHLPLLQSDLNPYVNKYEFDLRAIETELLSRVQAYSDKGELYAIPYTRTLYAMFYNKEIFDNRNVGYPVDGMTWEESMELAKKVIHMVDGTRFRGLEPLAGDLGPAMYMDQFGLRLIDASSSKPAILNEEWKEMGTLLRLVYSIPGNEPDLSTSLGPNEFSRNGTVAMALSEGFDLLTRGARHGRSVDLVSYPSLSHTPGVGPGSRSEILLIPSGSKQKDAAFQVITHLLSEEVQLAKSRLGSGTVLNKREIMLSYGADIPEAQGKNVQAFFENSPRSIPNLHPYEPTIYLNSLGPFADLAGFTGQDLEASLARFDRFVEQSIRALDEQMSAK